MQDKKVVILAGSEARHFAPDIARIVNGALYRPRVGRYHDRTIEIDVPIAQGALAGRPVVIVQGLRDRPQDSLFELLLLAGLAADSGAARLITCVPCFPYGRGDWRDHAGRPLPAKVVARVLNACHVDAFVTLDAHSPQLAGFFDFPFISVGVDEIFGEWLARASFPGDSVTRLVVSPDAGGFKRAQSLADVLGLDVMVFPKQRDHGRVTRPMPPGAVAGEHVLLVDDAVLSWQTIRTAGAELTKRGAASVFAVVTHCPPLSGSIAALSLTGIVTSDSLADGRRNDGVLTVPAAPALARAIRDLLGHVEYEERQ